MAAVPPSFSVSTADTDESGFRPLERLNGVIARLRDCRTRTDIAQITLDFCREEFGARTGSVFLRARNRPGSADADILELVTAVGYPQDLLLGWKQIPLTAPVPAAYSTLTGQPLFIASRGEWAERYPHIAVNPHLKEDQARATVPLIASHGTMGSLVFSFAEERSFPREERIYLSLLAAQCAQALERLQLMEKGEAALAARASAEQGYRDIFDSTFQFIGLLSPDGLLLKVNRAALDFGGLVHDEVIGRPVWELRWLSLTPAVGEQMKAAISRAVSTGQLVRDEMELVGAGGRVITIDFSLNPVRDDQGRIAYLIAEGRDISERKALDNALRESERRLREAQAVARIGSWELDVATGRITWSPETFRLLGRDPLRSEPDLEDALHDYHPADRPLLMEAIRRAVTDGIPYEFELRLVRKDGSERLVCAIGRPVRDDQGRIARLVGTVQDITDQRLLERQVIETEKMAALGLLASGVAKEISDPLAALSGTAQLLEMHPDIQVADDARVIRRMAGRAHEIVRALRSAMPVGAEALRADLYPGDLNWTVADTLKLLNHSIRHAETRLELDLAETLPPVLFDPSGIKQVLIHLVTNALQAMEDVPPPQRRLLVRTNASSTGRNGHVFLSVSDSGCGIPEDILPRIFDLFFTTRVSGERAGIGLSLCRGIIENHGGEITVQSRPGYGTTFCVRLIPDDSEL